MQISFFKLYLEDNFILKQKTVEDSQTSFEPWSFKRPGILAKYTTNEKLSLKTSFLNINANPNYPASNNAASSNPTGNNKG